jgi:hypothetical protein
LTERLSQVLRFSGQRGEWGLEGGIENEVGSNVQFVG